MEIEKYPGNSDKAKHNEEKKPRPEMKPIVKQKVELRERSVGEKVKGVVWGPSAKAAITFIGVSVLLPAVKDMLEDAATTFIRGMFNGGDYNRPGPSKGPGGGTYTSYNAISSKKAAQAEERRQMSERAMANHDFRELKLESRAEGEAILEQLRINIAEYDITTVKDMYDLAGITGSFVDEKWGWNNLDRARVELYRGGYILRMPRTMPLD